jgi:hypothetical protein
MPRMSDTGSSSIKSVSTETRVFPPPAEFAARAGIGSREAYDALYARSVNEPDAFWDEQARAFHWFTPHQQVLDWQPPHAKWFVGGTTNAGLQLPRPAPAGRAPATRPRSSSRASRATRARSPTASCTRGV